MPPRRPVAEPATEAELDALAEISVTDIAHAAQQWRKDAPYYYSAILDAAVEQGTDATS